MSSSNAPGSVTQPNSGKKLRRYGIYAVGVVVAGVAVWWGSTWIFDDMPAAAASDTVKNETAPEIPAAPWPEKTDDPEKLKKNHPDRAASLTEKTVPVPVETTTGNKERSEGQKQFAKIVADYGTREQVIVVDGKEYPMPPPGQTQEIDPRAPTIGYKLEKDQFATYTYKSMVVARAVEETLNGVNDANVYPGRVFLANPFFQNGKVEEANVSAEVWAPVKIAVYGPTIKTKPDGKPVDFPTSYGTPDNAAGRRGQFETARAQIARSVTQVGAWKEVTETTYSKEHLELQASLKVSGDFGFVSGEVKTQSHQENSTIYMMLTQEAYRIAVDDADTAAGWVVPNPQAEHLAQLKDAKSPLLYVSEVIYGRVILVAVTSQLSIEDLKIIVKGDVKAWRARIAIDAKKELESKLEATTFSVLSFGGPSRPGKHCKVDEYSEELTRLKEAKLEGENALPIAFKTCWLATKKQASWAGVTPLRFATVERSPITYSVKLKNYSVKDTHCTERRIGERHPITRVRSWENVMVDGWMGIAARDVRDKYDNYKLNVCNMRLGGGGSHNANKTLLDEVPIPKAKFELCIRQGEKEGAEKWDDLKSNSGAFKEKSFEVDVQKLLDTESREMNETIEFSDGNKAEIQVRVNAPVAKRLGELPAVPNAKPVTK